jgi:hypothetical protein
MCGETWSSRWYAVHLCRIMPGDGVFGLGRAGSLLRDTLACSEVKPASGMEATDRRKFELLITGSLYETT